MIHDLIEQLDGQLEQFLARWSFFLKTNGISDLVFWTRHESIEAFYLILKNFQKTASLDHTSSLSCFQDHLASVIKFFVQKSRKQCTYGATPEMVLLGFKSMQMAFEDLFEKGLLLTNDKVKYHLLFRRFFDAIELSLTADFGKADVDTSLNEIKQINRFLAQEKHNYESIFELTSNLVLIVDDDYIVKTANPATRSFFVNINPEGLHCADLLGLTELKQQKVSGQIEHLRNSEVTIEITGIKRTFNLQVKPLRDVSVSLCGAILILTDITCMVDHQHLLEQKIEERTRALSNSEKMLDSIFQSVGKGILLIDKDFEIIEANYQASEMYGIPLEILVGSKLSSLIDDNGLFYINNGFQTLLEGQIRTIEATSKYVDGRIFPTHMVMTCMVLNEQRFWPIIASDISEQLALENGLRKEKKQTEEMNVTLRNVLNSIEDDRKNNERQLSKWVRSSILPGLEKIRHEKNYEVRSSYLNILKDDILSYSSGAENKLDGDLLKLSKTELKICRFIKSGQSGKEISEAMNLSFETIQTHRKNIRKKLGLSGKTVNLHAFLVNRNIDWGGIVVE